jgi:hypothetical protein
MIGADLVEWMDEHFGHDITDVFFNVTVVHRCVDLAFRHPSLRLAGHLAGPIKVLLQTGYAREYRHANWSEIGRNRAYAHVIGGFVNARALPHQMAEAKAVIVGAILHLLSGQGRD